jgi:hypothetical protein
MSLIKTYQAGQKLLDEKRALDNICKSSHLRAGNSACIVGCDVVGGCHRKAFLRSKGFDTPVDFATSLMFDGGHGNEENWMKTLGAYAAANNLKVVAEEDYPLEWKLADGTTVSGRPDMVLLGADDVPLLGIELKAVCALNTYKNTIIEKKPKTENLAQAMHYMWLLRQKNPEAGYKLVYTSRVNYPVAGYYQKDFPKQGQPGSEHCEYNARGDIKTARPAMSVFDLDLRDGMLSYKPESEQAWTVTNLSIDGLKAFYEAVATMEKDGDLGPRPQRIDCHGAKTPYDICNYCDLGPMCSAYESAGFHTWYKHCSKLLTRS